MGIQGIAAIDALLADEVEVPGLVTLHGDTTVPSGRRHVARVDAGVGLGVIGISPKSVNSRSGVDDFTLGSHDVSVVVNPALITHEDLNRASVQDAFE